MRTYVVEYHRVEPYAPGAVFQVLGTYYANSAAEALAKCPWRTTSEHEFLWARRAEA